MHSVLTGGGPGARVWPCGPDRDSTTLDNAELAFPQGGLLSLLLGLGLIWGYAPVLRAQDAAEPYQVRWYVPVIAAAGVSVFFLVDNPVRTYMLDHQTTGRDNAADIFRAVGQPEVWALVPAVMIGTGLAFHETGPGAKRAPCRYVRGTGWGVPRRC